MQRFARLRLSWIPGPTTGIVRRILETNLGGDQQTISVPPDGPHEWFVVAPANSVFRYKSRVETADGLLAYSIEASITLGNLETPVADSGLGIQIVKVLTENPEPGPGPGE